MTLIFVIKAFVYVGDYSIRRIHPDVAAWLQGHLYYNGHQWEILIGFLSRRVIVQSAIITICYFIVAHAARTHVKNVYSQRTKFRNDLQIHKITNVYRKIDVGIKIVFCNGCISVTARYTIRQRAQDPGQRHVTMDKAGEGLVTAVYRCVRYYRCRQQSEGSILQGR